MPKISHCCGEKIVSHSITGQKICSRCGYCAKEVRKKTKNDNITIN